MTQPIRFALYSLGLAAIVIALLWIGHARAAGCPAAPQGLPDVPGAALVCKPGYAALIDTVAKVPRVVVETLDGKQIVGGCFKRQNNFHAEPGVPTAKPGDYLHSGYDLGHQRPAEDADYGAADMSDTFSTANMAPQLPGLNRQGWKGLETWVRAYALKAGSLIVYTGPILPPNPKTIGADKVAIPTGFYKVTFDPILHMVEAFIYPQAPVAEDSPPAMHRATLAEVDAQAGLTLPIPDGATGEPFPAPDLKTWAKAHAAACH